MAGVIRKAQVWKRLGAVERIAREEWSYPTGMVWCPMKMSGMALMKCAEMQKEFGCGSLRQLRTITASAPSARAKKKCANYGWLSARSGRLRRAEKIPAPTVARRAVAAKLSAPAIVAAAGVSR